MSFIFVCHFYIGTILGKMTLQRLFYLFATVSDWKHSLRFFASASRKTTATTTKIFHWFDPFALFLSFVLPRIVHSYFIAFVHDSFYRCIWPVRLSLAHTVIFNLGRCNRNDAPGEREREKKTDFFPWKTFITANISFNGIFCDALAYRWAITRHKFANNILSEWKQTVTTMSIVVKSNNELRNKKKTYCNIETKNQNEKYKPNI